MSRWGMIVIGIVAITAAAVFLFQNELAPLPRAAPGPFEVPTSVDRAPRRPDIVEPSPVEPSPSPAPIDPKVEATAPRPAPALPALVDSDPFVRQKLEKIGLPQEWLSQDDLVRKLAVFIDNATRGELARRPLAFLEPAGRYEHVEREGRLYADPRNALRFDRLLDLLESVDPEAAGRFFQMIDPLLETALQELGSTRPARQTLDEVIERIVETPKNAIGQELVQSKVLYEYKEAEYETLPPFEKQLLRLGARNLARLERYLRALRAGMTAAK